MPNRNRRRMEIRIKRNKRAKRKKSEGYVKVIERRNGKRKVRFVKPAETV